MTMLLRRFSLFRSIGIVCALVCGTASLLTAKPPIPKVVSFWIDEMAFPSTNTLFGDDQTSPTDFYKDYRLTNSNSWPVDPNDCVEASPDSSGFLFIRFNRKLDGDAGTQFCSSNGGTSRQFSLQINSQSACNELRSNSYVA